MKPPFTEIMKTIFVFDNDKDALGEAVAMITTGDYATFLVRGVIRPLPETKNVEYPNDEYDVGFGDGWDACLKEITE